jgi:hypothetical protein
MANKLLTRSLSVTLDGATAADVDVDCGTGNLTIDALPGGERVLAAGELQYLKKQGMPSLSVVDDLGRATLALKAADPGPPRLRFPWAACAAATDRQVHLTPPSRATSPLAVAAATSG